MALGLFLVAPAGAEPAAAPVTTPHNPSSAAPLPPPPQMRSIHALLGSYKCTDDPSPGALPSTLYMTNTKGLGGHYLDSYVEIRPHVLRGRSSIGWDPVGGRYSSVYSDDWGSAYTMTASGWDDGHLTFTGSVMQVTSPDPTGHAQGVRLGLKNDYKVLGRGHFFIVQILTLPDGRTVQHNYDCRRR